MVLNFDYLQREQSICRRKDCKNKFCEPKLKSCKNYGNKDVKGQFFIDIAELKDAKYNFWLEKAEF